ncbi:hypothetical protein [Cupriavidus sp. DF5525]|uniref:hypothetical protein n=1 Tax=Cupriavidus sp. DF5525 TaxID=3160989 RepID=UPI0026C5846C
MKTESTTLRGLLEKWVGLDTKAPARVTRIRPPSHCTGCVQVDVAGASGGISLFFFRHADGSWCVFPPSPMGP